MDNISTNLEPCGVCTMSKWGVTLDETGGLISYCTVCAGDYANTKEARSLAESE